MNRVILTAFISLGSVAAMAQDVITTKDGDEIESKVMKISSAEIEYKKWSNPDGPTYTIEKSKVFMIKYQNGEKEVIKAVQSGSNSNSSQTGEISFVPDDNNSAIIAKYNAKAYELGKSLTPKAKDMSDIVGIWGITASSQMSNSDIEVTLVPYEGNEDLRMYHLSIKNKTDNILYIDLGNSFTRWSNNDDDYYCYYEGLSKNVSKGSSSMMPVPILGMGIGFSSTTTNNYSQQRMLAIPPKGSKVIAKDPHFKEKEEDITPARDESFNVQCSPDEGRVVKSTYGQVLNFTESDTPCKRLRNYIITYSKDEKFATYTRMKIDFFLRETIGYDAGDIDYDSSIIKDMDDYCIVGAFRQY